MKRIYEIEHNNDLGEGWMNVWNLDSVVHTKEHCFEGACKIIDITDPENPILARDYSKTTAGLPEK